MDRDQNRVERLMIDLMADLLALQNSLPLATTRTPEFGALLKTFGLLTNELCMCECNALIKNCKCVDKPRLFAVPRKD